MERRNTPFPDAVDVDAVRGVEILDGYCQVGDADTRVAPRDEWVVEREIALGRAADDDAVVRRCSRPRRGCSSRTAMIIAGRSISLRPSWGKAPEGWCKPVLPEVAGCDEPTVECSAGELRPLLVLGKLVDAELREQCTDVRFHAVDRQME